MIACMAWNTLVHKHLEGSPGVDAIEVTNKFHPIEQDRIAKVVQSDVVITNCNSKHILVAHHNARKTPGKTE